VAAEYGEVLGSGAVMGDFMETKDDKIAFIEALCDAIKRETIARVDAMPATWDGLELREYLADEFDRARHMSNKFNNRNGAFKARLRDYKNDVLISERL